ncbi:MAG: hypothetical protein WCI71_16095 [Bacteroidota bacterium]
MVQIEDMQMINDQVQLLHRLIEKQTALIIQFIKVLYEINADFKIISEGDAVYVEKMIRFNLSNIDKINGQISDTMIGLHHKTFGIIKMEKALDQLKN